MTARKMQTNEPGALIITGDALEGELVLNLSEWKLDNPDFVDALFSSNNHFGYHKIWRVKGYDLYRLLAEAGLREVPGTTVTFVASDGFSYTETLESLTARCCFPDLTAGSEEPAMPMIVLYSALMFDEQDPRPPVFWKARPLTEADYDRQRPRMMMGQRKDDPSDDNQAYFVGDMVKIVVGKEQE
ncbi:MAG: hypothetical protein SCK57_03840 [Bacillota bacterium]|nr:hypothetical protein [Bacillota bacterium]MDW7676771.1 hypothetical protein [Bacillota bacterium]